MSKKTQSIGELEEVLLLAVRSLQPVAYGVPIFQMLEYVGRRTSLGAIYTTLERLEAKGFIKSKLGDPIPERGGRSRRYYELSGHAEQILDDSEARRTTIRNWGPAYAKS